MIGVMTAGVSKGRREHDLRDLPQVPSLAQVVRGWDGARPLAVVCGGGPAWPKTIVASPRQVFRVESDGRARWLSDGAEVVPPCEVGRGAMEDVREVLRWGREHRRRNAATAGAGERSTSGWVVSLSYELGEVVEPAARRGRGRGLWPLVEMQRCEDVVELSGGEWSREVRGGPGRGFETGALESETGRERFEQMVARTVEYIRAGDVFQANIAHRLSGEFSGSARAAFAALWESARPWHGAYLEMQGSTRRALLSASPELFVNVEPGGRVVTRPMKGTVAASRGAAELERSAKDAAELNMIVDLMRNDLGRVCRFGSVKVEEARAIERHGESSTAQISKAANSEETGGVWQGVGTVVGELREGLDVVDVLCAAFPAGSVTGAPKIRAMQIIDELEDSERGPYCGSIGWIGDDGEACLNVAIRTAVIEGEPGAALDEIRGRVSYSVGAGIVAESVPRREWEETMVKAGVIRKAERHEGT